MVLHCLERSGQEPLTFRGCLVCETRTSPKPVHPRYSGSSRLEHRVSFYKTEEGCVALAFTKVNRSDARKTWCAASLHPSLAEAADALLLVPSVNNRLYNFVIDDLLKLADSSEA